MRSPSLARCLSCAFVPLAALVAVNPNPRIAAQQSANPPVSFLDAHAAAVRANPEGVSLKIAFKDGATRFHQGEVMRLELRFTSSVPGRWALSLREYDRSGRLNIDRFFVDPADNAIDPLREHFGGSSGGLGGISPGPQELTERQQLIGEDLNEWLRFDAPGKYRLYVVSNRPEPFVRGDGTPWRAAEVASDILEFDILPAVPQSVDEVRKLAARTLRFLGTEAAAREMVHRLATAEDHPSIVSSTDDRSPLECRFGLVGSPQRVAIIREMERMIDEGNERLPQVFLETLAEVAAVAKHPLPARTDADERAASAWRQDYPGLLAEYTARAMRAAGRMAPANRAATLAALVTTAWSDRRGVSEADLAAAAAELPLLFDQLPPDTQYDLLRIGWRSLAGPAMLPALRRIYDDPPDSRWPIRERALVRLRELAPAEGRRLVLDEIRHPSLGVSLAALDLQAGEMDLQGRDLDQRLVENLFHPPSRVAPPGTAAREAIRFQPQDLTAGLVARYATASVAPDVRSFYESTMDLSCETEAALLAFFLRVDPKFGNDRLDRVLASPGCSRVLLGRMAQLDDERVPLEDAAIRHLDDPDAWVAVNAAEALQSCGSARARDALFTRFEKWHQQWDGHADQLAFQTGVRTDDAVAAQRRLEDVLRVALSWSRGWEASENELARMNRLCVTSQCRDQVRILADSAGSNEFVTASLNEGTWRYRVGMSEFSSLNGLERKLSQYPSGSTFSYQPSAEMSREQQAQILAELRKVTSEHHQILQVLDG